MSLLKHDPIEDDPEVKKIIEKVDKLIEKKLKDHPMNGCMGFCFVFWNEKQKILKEKYDIAWRSPAEMNPGTLFD